MASRRGQGSRPARCLGHFLAPITARAAATGLASDILNIAELIMIRAREALSQCAMSERGHDTLSDPLPRR